MTSTVISQKFEVICVVGQGGQGTVYKVRHTDLNKIRALKLLPEHLAEDPSLVARFKREGRVMAGLSHRNIVEVFDITRDKNLYYIVEEFVEGKNLTEYLKARHPLPIADVLEIARQLADALKYAHSKGVIHRDIKPSNVLIKDQLPLHALLTDFGIAKVADASDQTQTGSLLGTIRYASPEQLGYRGTSGRTQVDGRADIYALGLVMFEICEGVAFFDGLEQHEVIGTLVYEREPLVPRFSRPIPEKFVAIVTKAICRDPAERYQSMDEVLTAIEECQQRVLQTSNDSTVRTRIPIVAELAPPAEQVSDQELEDRIRALETERQRRLALSAQDETRGAREKATAGKADELAGTVFADAQEKEVAAVHALQDGNFPEAANLFNTASKLFARAVADAAAVRSLREAERARDAMLEVKQAAEREGAPDSARTLYGRGLTLEADAEEHRQHQGYEDARQTFLDARRFYEEARDRARTAARKAAAESARAQAQAAYRTAMDAAAEQLAPAALERARQQEAAAEAALAAADFSTALERFDATARAYAEVLAEARIEQLRRRAFAVRGEARAARTAATRENAARFASQSYEDGVRLQADAEQALVSLDWDTAIAAFEAATTCFQRAAAEAAEGRRRAEAEAREREAQRRVAQEARSGAQLARTAADRAAAAEHASELYKQASGHLDAGDVALGAGDYGHAGQCFTAAQAAFTQAAADAAAAYLLQQAEQAREGMLASKRAADKVGAPDMAETLYRRAVSLEAQANDRWQQPSYEEARHHYEGALDLYKKAEAWARSQAARRTAEEARDQMQAAEAAAVEADAQELARSLFSTAASYQSRAEAAQKAGDYPAAVELFTGATQAYEQAAVAAKQERLRQHATTARDAAALALAAARRARAEQYAREIYQSGVEHHEHAVRHLAAETYDRAITDFERATAAFDEAAAAAAAAEEREAALAAERERQRQQALEAQAAAAAARRSADDADAATGATELHRQAANQELAATAALEAEEFLRAKDLFEDAERRFGVAAATAATVRVQSLAEAAQRAALAARRAAEAEGAPEVARAVYGQGLAAEAQAEEQWDAQHYEAAERSYEQARRLFQQAQHEARRARLRAEAEQAQAGVAPVRAAALEAGADAYARELLETARTQEQRAQTALAAGEFSVAAEQFAAALRTYEQASSTARQERQRQQVQAVRNAARHAQATAVEAQAAEFAAGAYQEAVRLQAEAERTLAAAQDYPKAVEGFVRAEERFAEAAAEAAAGRDRRDAEASRTATVAARRATEAEGGAEVARGVYGQGLAAEAQAEEEWNAQHYAQARLSYEDAQRLYQEAQEQARRASLRAAAEQARADMAPARTAAVKTGAETYARELFETARTHEQQAEAALGSGEFAGAAEQFAAAQRAYEQAGRTAQQDRQRQQVQAVRNAAQHARTTAVEAQAAEYASQPYQEALRLHEEAERVLATAQDYPKAAEGFVRAEEKFTEAATAAASARARRDAEATRSATVAVRRAAEAAGAAEAARAVYGQGLAAEAQAEEEWNAQHYAEARCSYDEARRLYQEAQEQARLTTLRTAAEEAHAGVAPARAASLEAGAEAHAPELFEAGRTQEQRALAAVGNGEFAAAVEQFGLATDSYQRAAAAARETQLRQQAERARQRVRDAESKAAHVNAAHYTAQHYDDATRVLLDGERTLAAGTYESAISAFETAAERFEQAAAAAAAAAEREAAEERERTRQQRVAEDARAAALASRAAADHANAPRDAADVYAEARSAFDAGEHLVQAADPLAAAKQYETSSDLFARAVIETERAHQRQVAEAARTAARAAREQAELCDALRYSRDQYEAALAQQADAERAFASGDFTGVQLLFDESARLFRAAAAAAKHSNETERAHQAKARFDELRQGIHVSGFAAKRQYKRSLRAAETGDQCLPDEPGQATTHYATAITLVEPLTGMPAQAEPSRRSSYAIGATLVVAVVAATAWYVSRPPVPVQQEQPTPVPLPQPLVWNQVSPPGSEQQVQEGEHLHLAAEVRDPQQYRELHYVWLLDGEERAQGPSWDYAPGSDEGGKTREVTVVASARDQKIEQTWRIHVSQPNRPPSVDAISPQAELVDLATGGSRQFSVKAHDPDAAEADTLTYTWERNGVQVASGKEPIWTLRDATEQDTEVRVTVTDKSGARAEPHKWVLAIAKPPPPVNVPPRIVSQLPRSEKLKVQESENLDFSVRAEDPNSSASLTYAWLLDGREVGRGPKWQFVAPAPAETTGVHKIEVEVSDQAGLKAPRAAWTVEVRAVPPKIASFQPRDRKISVDAGQTREFEVTATAAGAPGNLQYEWSIGGQPQPGVRGNRFRLPETLAAGEHEVAVAAIDPRGLRSSLQRWRVDINAAHEPPPPVTERPRAKPTVAEPVQLSEAEVRNWLARFQDAWQRKDVAALRKLGVIASGQEAALLKILQGYKQLQVSIRKEKIDLDGESATVSFDRTDTDETGHPLEYPRQTYRLQKGPGGVTAASGS